MFRSVFEAIFGCAHQRTTFPLTPKRREGQGAVSGSCYVCCLDCGREFPYNWGEMRIGKSDRPVIANPSRVRA